jgi:hypothetical protein
VTSLRGKRAAGWSAKLTTPAIGGEVASPSGIFAQEEPSGGEGAEKRLRLILMPSLAFVFGTLPVCLATEFVSSEPFSDQSCWPEGLLTARSRSR